MCDQFEAEGRPSNFKDGPAYKPYPLKPSSPGGGDGSPPPAVPPVALASPVGRSIVQRSRQQSQLSAAMALAAAAFSGGGAASTPPTYDSPSPSRGRPAGPSGLGDAPQRSGSHSLPLVQQLQQQQQLVPNLVVEFSTFVTLFMREPPRLLRTMHTASSAVVDGVEVASRPSRKGGPRGAKGG